MIILVTGGYGQLGHDVIQELTNQGFKNILAPGRNELDLTHAPQVSGFFKQHQPEVIIHCAAYTAVDLAETETEACRKVNIDGTRHLVEQAQVTGATLLYISTDYVFDGNKETAYEVDDLPNPQSVYGLSKHLGEMEVRKLKKHFIVRISWVFGVNGANFVKTMLRLGKTQKEIKVVHDQVGSPTYTVDVAKTIVALSQTNHYGTYHVTNEGFCSWYDFAKEIFALKNHPMVVHPIPSSSYPTKAMRPKNSRLSKRKLDTIGLSRLPDWHDALKRYIKELGE
jgi:dTDP-4-dehydrorhamnose reductase